MTEKGFVNMLSACMTFWAEVLLRFTVVRIGEGGEEGIRLSGLWISWSTGVQRGGWEARLSSESGSERERRGRADGGWWRGIGIFGMVEGEGGAVGWNGGGLRWNR